MQNLELCAYITGMTHDPGVRFTGSMRDSAESGDPCGYVGNSIWWIDPNALKACPGVLLNGGNPCDDVS